MHLLGVLSSDKCRIVSLKPFTHQFQQKNKKYTYARQVFMEGYTNVYVFCNYVDKAWHPWTYQIRPRY